MEGPQFSTRAESELYRQWGASVIGMTNMPEAKLAREAELCYATVAMVTDFDCWHPDHDAVTVEAVVAVLLANADRARDLVAASVPALGAPRNLCPCGCQRALDNAVITATHMRDPASVARLDAVAGRVLGAERGCEKGQGALPPGPPPGNKSPGPLSLRSAAGTGWVGSESRVGRRSLSDPRPTAIQTPTHRPHGARTDGFQGLCPWRGSRGQRPWPFFSPPTSPAGAWRGASSGLSPAPSRWHPWRLSFLNMIGSDRWPAL